MSERSKTDRYRNNLLALFDQGLVSLSSFLVTVFVGRFGSDEQLGLYSLGMTFVIAMVTLEESLIAMPYVFLAGKQENLRTYVGSSIAQVFTLGLVASAALIVGSVAGQYGLLPKGLSPVLLVIAAIVPFHLMRQFIRRFFFATLDVGGLLFYDVLACVIQVGLLGTVYWFGRVLGTTGHLSIGIAGLVMTGLWMLRYRSDYAVVPKQAIADAKSNWGFAKYVGSAQFLWILHIQLLVWFLTYSHGTAVAGQFGACLAITLLANPFVLGMLNIVSPRVVKAYDEGGSVLLRSTVWQNWWFMVGGVSLLFLGLAVAGGSVVKMIFGGSFANHHMVITLLAGAMLAETACKTPEQGLQAIGKPKLVAIINLVRLILTLALAAFLVPRAGLVGAAWTLVIADLVAAVMMGALFSRETSQSPPHHPHTEELVPTTVANERQTT